MAKKASGQELIDHKSVIADNLGEHFNNPDISDVTLAVGDQVFAAHRLILATQSKVFMAMLMGESWKESEEKKITLQESPQGEVVFSDFLKFFYTGTLTLTIDNVCGIHTLADKYDVSVLKDDCVNFMKEVLTGVHGDALKAGLEWLQYMETFLPDMVSLCYSTFRTNFAGVVHMEKYKEAFWKLNLAQIRTIFSYSEVREELTVMSERTLLEFIQRGRLTQALLPYIRFYNIPIDKLQSIETKNGYAKIQVTSAYKIHAERNDIASRACKRRRLSQTLVQVSCSCDSPNVDSRCPHINPRQYLRSPFGKYSHDKSMAVEPINLSDLTGFSQKLLFHKDSDASAKWSIHQLAERAYSEDPICETYEVIPARCHIGMQFTLVIVCLKMKCKESKLPEKYEYTIKYTGEVTESDYDIETDDIEADSVILKSPLRFQDSWKIGEEHALGVSILLHN